MKLSDVDRIAALLQQSGIDHSTVSPQELQQFLREKGLSAGNFYQELEMDSAYVDAHEDVSTSRDEVQLHSHTFHELLYCLSGNLDYLVGTQRYRLHRGDIVIIPPGISHRPLFLGQLTEPYRRMVLWISCSPLHSTIWCALPVPSGKCWSNIFVPPCRRPDARNWAGRPLL